MNRDAQNLELQPVRIRIGPIALEGDLGLPAHANGIVMFAHGSGSSRLSPRNRFVARSLRGAGLATLLFDLLTPSEEERDALTRQYRFDIPRLADRLIAVTDWLEERSETRHLQLGYFGASTGAAAALCAAAERPERVKAVVSRGGRPDLAGDALARVQAPTLLIVGELDTVVLELNRKAMQALRAETRIEVVPGATHLFEEPGRLERVAALAASWFETHLRPVRVSALRDAARAQPRSPQSVRHGP